MTIPMTPEILAWVGQTAEKAYDGSQDSSHLTAARWAVREMVRGGHVARRDEAAWVQAVMAHLGWE
jgi:hypothetical protein